MPSIQAANPLIHPQDHKSIFTTHAIREQSANPHLQSAQELRAWYHRRVPRRSAYRENRSSEDISSRDFDEVEDYHAHAAPVENQRMEVGVDSSAYKLSHDVQDTRQRVSQHDTHGLQHRSPHNQESTRHSRQPQDQTAAAGPESLLFSPSFQDQFIW